jgi:hypothetical protein
MKEYKLVNHHDGNDEIELGEHESEEQATIAAFDTLGWSLVEVQYEDEDDE